MPRICDYICIPVTYAYGNVFRHCDHATLNKDSVVITHSLQTAKNASMLVNGLLGLTDTENRHRSTSTLYEIPSSDLYRITTTTDMAPTPHLY